MNKYKQEDILNQKELSRLTGFCLDTLRKYRGLGMPYFTYDDGRIYYNLQSVQEWMGENLPLTPPRKQKRKSILDSLRGK